MSTALSLVKGRGILRSEIIGLPSTLTSKLPLRGFSGFMFTSMSGSCAVTRLASLFALVLNAFHDLHASMTTPMTLVAALVAAAAVFLTMVFLGGIESFLLQESRNLIGPSRCE